MSTTLTWLLWPPDAFLTAQDEFIVGPLRIQLNGSTLTVVVESAQSHNDVITTAEKLAGEYVRRLATHLRINVRLLTHSELAKMPAWAILTRAPPGLGTAELGVHRQRFATAIRHARNDIVLASESTLRQCYDYFQKAHEHEENYLSELYKMVETMENTFGGEDATISALNLKSELKFIKQLANVDWRDQRHPPKNPKKVSPPSTDDRQRAKQSASRLLRAFEQRVRSGNN